MILKHVMTKDKKLLRDLLSDDECFMVRKHVADIGELTEIFTYCDESVLNDEMINQLLTQCGWNYDGDEIRAVIISKGKAVGVTEENMYSFVNPRNGNIPLFECVVE